MINLAVYSKNPFYRLYILRNRDYEGEDNPLAIVGLHEQKYCIQSSQEIVYYSLNTDLLINTMGTYIFMITELELDIHYLE